MKKVNVQSSSINAEGSSKTGLQTGEQTIFLPKGTYKNPAGGEFPIIAYDDIYRCFSDHLTCEEDKKGIKIAAAFTTETNNNLSFGFRINA